MLFERLFRPLRPAQPPEALDHPALRGLSPRELADLPLPRPWDAPAEASRRPPEAG